MLAKKGWLEKEESQRSMAGHNPSQGKRKPKRVPYSQCQREDKLYPGPIQLKEEEVNR